ncbi:hypothetical protein QSJ19_11970 [Gordonia sp. ABSL11-1]|uniref:hypothetical protein n=1 Tax=Gordonia sp. ABSL11-1 TaxID=3053924 RepID=UPI0025736103|nr:hypothetical protein [Gordonia sp. ABSL11-1]MDL9946301.1 hypothetical protein [Gordonia sp. ABSL11-1]
MKRRISLAIAGAAVVAGVGSAVAPTAGASPLEPHPVISAGSVTFCINIPLGPFNISIC